MNKKMIYVAALAVFLSAPVLAGEVANRISPLTTYPTASDPNGLYQTVEHVAIGQIGEALPGGVYLSAKGYNLTTGYKFDKGRFEYTYISYKEEDAPAGIVLQSGKMTGNIFHLAYLLPVKHNYGQWTGDALIGIRWFDNKVGELGELYASREFNKENMKIVLGANVIERSTRFNRRIGVYLDGRYEYRPGLSVLGEYYSADFFKNIMNDYAASSMYPVSVGDLGCDACSEDTAAVGLSYNRLFDGRGTAYFLYYFMGEQRGYIPMFGLTARL